LIEATRANLLVSPIDANGERVRLHSVLRDALLRMLHGDDRFDVIALHRRAQGWYADNGFASKAIDHAIAASDHQFAAELIWVHWFGYWATGRLETARRWVDALPEPVIYGYPPLLVVASWISGVSGDATAMRRYAEAAVNAEFDEPVPAGSLSYSSVLTMLRANVWSTGVTESRRLAEAAYEREARGSPSARLLAVLLGSSRIATGDYDGGRAVLEEDVIGAGPPDAASAYAAGQLALLDVLRGRWIQAAERAAATIQLMRDGGFDNDVTSGAAYVAAAVTAARAGDVADAKRHLRAINAMKHAISSGTSFDGFEIHTFAAETQLLLGDVVAARSHAQRAADYLDILGDGGVYAARLDAVTAEIAAQLVDGQPAPDEGPKSLTVRERQILHLLQSDLTLREIGHELYISRNTVKTHTSHIYKKLGVSSREELRRARELDLI
jgi:LuxR family maltose regulon positive regulatory protein